MERDTKARERESKTYKDIGDTAATIFGAPFVGGLHVEAENASSVTAKARHGSYLTAQWVNGKSWRVLPSENLIPDLGVCSLVRVFCLAEWLIGLFDLSYASVIRMFLMAWEVAEGGIEGHCRSENDIIL